MSLAAKSVEKVNAMRDPNGMSYAHKAMIKCGLALDIDDVWRVSQLLAPLQDIVALHHMPFCGVPPGNFRCKSTRDELEEDANGNYSDNFNTEGENWTMFQF